MKRLAIQLYGHLRTFEHTFKYFKQNVINANINDGYEVDIFIHTWNQLNTNTITHYNQDGTQIVESNLTQRHIDLANDLYNPKKILIEPQREHEELLINSHYFNKISIKGPYNLSYSMMKSSELRREYEQEKNIKYDWVILTRPDIIFQSPFKIDTFFALHTRYNAHKVKNGYYYLDCSFARGNKVNDPVFIGGNDLIGFATPDNMDIATNYHKFFYDNINIDDYYCNEEPFYRYWIKSGLQPISFLYKQEEYIIRKKEDLQNINIKSQIVPKNKNIYLFGIPFFRLIYKNNRIKFTFLGISILKIKWGDK